MADKLLLCSNVERGTTNVMWKTIDFRDEKRAELYVEHLTFDKKLAEDVRTGKLRVDTRFYARNPAQDEMISMMNLVLQTLNRPNSYFTYPVEAIRSASKPNSPDGILFRFVTPNFPEGLNEEVKKKMVSLQELLWDQNMIITDKCNIVLDVIAKAILSARDSSERFFTFEPKFYRELNLFRDEGKTRTQGEALLREYKISLINSWKYITYDATRANKLPLGELVVSLFEKHGSLIADSDTEALELIKSTRPPLKARIEFNLTQTGKRFDKEITIDGTYFCEHVFEFDNDTAFANALLGVERKSAIKSKISIGARGDGDGDGETLVEPRRILIPSGPKKSRVTPEEVVSEEIFLFTTVKKGDLFLRLVALGLPNNHPHMHLFAKAVEGIKTGVPVPVEISQWINVANYMAHQLLANGVQFFYALPYLREATMEPNIFFPEFDLFLALRSVMTALEFSSSYDTISASGLIQRFEKNQ